MICREARRLLNGYIDAELDLAGVLTMEEHLQACKRCRIEEAGLRALGAAARRHGDFGPAPEALCARLRSRHASSRVDAPNAWRRRLVYATSAGAAMMLAAMIGFKGVPADEKSPAAAHSKVVYHIAQADTASAALRTLANHLEAAPGVQVVVVAHNNGVNFLLRGARDETGELYATTLRKFTALGVHFRLCNNTLVRQGIEASRVTPEAILVPSGIAEIGRLQSQEGYVYMKL